MRTTIALLLLVASTSWVRSEGADKDRLKKLARLPTISLPISFTFKVSATRVGFVFPGDKYDEAKEMAAIRKAMRGDASDAQRFFRLWDLSDDEEESKKALDRAIELFAQQLKAEPKNAGVMGQLGRALAAKEDWKEADRLLRQAVKLDAKDAESRSALGFYLGLKAVNDLGGWEKLNPMSPNHLLGLARKGKLAGERVKAAEKLIDESLSWHDQAVALAPKESLLWQNRMVSRFFRDSLRPAARFLQGEEVEPHMFSAELLEDAANIARLRPNDPRAIAGSVVMECLRFSMEKGIPLGGDPQVLFQKLPTKTREWVSASINRLEKLSDKKDKQNAACACEVRGMLIFAFFRDDASKAEKCLRQAVTLDSTREQAWDMLMAAVAVGDDGDERLIAICKDRVKIRDTAKNRFLLAKGYERLGHFEKAEEQLRLALKLKKGPGDLLANLGLAAMRLKLGKDEAALKEAAILLDKASQGMKEKSDRDKRNEYAVTRAIYLGLKGDVPGAKKVLNKVLSRDPKNKQARDVLTALGK